MPSISLSSVSRKTSQRMKPSASMLTGSASITDSFIQNCKSFIASSTSISFSDFDSLLHSSGHSFFACLLFYEIRIGNTSFKQLLIKLNAIIFAEQAWSLICTVIIGLLEILSYLFLVLPVSKICAVPRDITLSRSTQSIKEIKFTFPLHTILLPLIFAKLSVNGYSRCRHQE